jgi:hypothetical protein
MSHSSRLADAGLKTFTATYTVSPTHEPPAAGVTLLICALPMETGAGRGAGLAVPVGELIVGLVGAGDEVGLPPLAVIRNISTHICRA